MRKNTTAKIKKRLKNRSLTIVDHYEGVHIKTRWKCNNCSYIWLATPASVICQKTGCPRCAGKFQSLETMENLAKSKEFEFLSVSYKTMNTKYSWKCRDGHIWMSSAAHIKGGTGCPYCKSHITEEACRFIFQEITGETFKKNRSVLGFRLELDGYCPKLNIAFEYQGKQHYSFIKHLHRRPEIHEAQKRRDDQKRSLCKERKIDLLEIPYYENNLEQFIRKQLESIGVECFETIDWKKFKGRISMLEELKIAADKLNIESLSDVYINARSKMSFRCKKCGREWESTSNDIKNGYGCLRCSGTMKLTTDEVRQRGKKMNITLLSKACINARTKLKWQCNKCDHIFFRVPPSIQQKRYCPDCGRRAGWKKRMSEIKT